MWMDNRRFNQIDSRFDRIESQFTHLVDMHISHGDRISKVEERTKDL
jgi:hypothetical protein